MTTDELISQAIHSINTNQPRMANLYMKNALEQTDQRRRELNPLAWQTRQMVQGFQNIGDAIAKAGQAWAQIIEDITRAFAPEPGIERKTDYALVGPGK